ncbi:MAG: hypothetical protein ABI550_05455 [Ignavibacteriaceae bacterium]
MKDEQKNKKIDLMKRLSIREGLREKLIYLYGQTFSDLFEILESAEDFDFYIQQYSIDEIFNVMNKSGETTIHLHSELAFNARLILQEIFDDYWAACLCFLNGFTKQCQSILRSTLELIICVYYLKYIKQNEVDNWASGAHGIEKIPDKIEALKSIGILKRNNLYARINYLYDQLCTAVHSQKGRMSSIQLPRMTWAKHMPSFEPTEILYTKGLFFSILNLEISLIHDFIKDGTQTDLSEKLINILETIINQIAKYAKTIEKFEKGYLVHKENIKINDKKNLLYSVRLDGSIEYPIKKKPKVTKDQAKLLKDQIEKRLVKDIA